MISGKVLSIDIGHRYIHIAEGKRGKKQIDISKHKIIDTPESSVKDGSIVDALALKTVLGSAVKSNHFKSDRVVISIKSPQVIVRDFSLPVVKPEEYASMVQLEMEQYVPNIATDYILGFVLQRTITNTPAAMIPVKAYAMPKKLVSEYTDVLKSIGLKPVVVDVHSNTVEKLVKNNFYPNGNVIPSVSWKSAAFVDFGYEYTEINIIREGRSVFNRSISTGCGKLWEEIARNSNFTLRQAEAAVAKNVDMRESNTDKIHETVKTYLNKLVNEIQTNIQFYVGRNQDNKPDMMYIYGGFSKLKGLSELMSNALNSSVVHFEDLSYISTKTVDQENPMDYTQFVNVLGAFIRND